MINSQNVETSLNSIENLPSLPIVIQQIQKALTNPNTSMKQISTIIEKDQGVSIKSIKLVNSAYYGLRKHITSIQEAIVVLGLDTVNNLMLGLSVIKMFEPKEKTLFDHQAFWEHALGCALISKELAKVCNNIEPDDCFIAGLLHDMGKLVFEQYMHEGFVSAIESTNEDNTSLLLQESNVFGFDHCDVGAFLAMKWKIPIQIILTMKYHHYIDKIPNDFSKHIQLITIVAKANQLCHTYHIGNSMEKHIDNDNVFVSLKLPSFDFDDIIQSIKNEIKSTLHQWQN